MAGGVFSGALLNGMTIRESATDGSDFTNPAADYRRLFLGEDGYLHVKDSAGNVTDPYTSSAGNVATDAIWDAAGDLAVGTGADTAAKLTLGATGTVPRSNGSTLVYAFPPGYEYDYAEYTGGNVSITATTEATANTIVTGNAVAYDGSTVVEIEFFAPLALPQATSTSSLIFYLYDGSSSIGLWGQVTPPTNASMRVPVQLTRRLTPSNASHTYSVRATTGSGTGIVAGGSGGTGNYMPLFIRITKV